MRSLVRLAHAFAAAFFVSTLLAGSAGAQLIVSEFIGIASGRIGAVTFTDADFAIVTESDTSGVVPFGNGWSLDDITASITIDGVGTADFTRGTRVFVNNTVNALGFSRFGISGMDLLDLNCDIDCTTWDLTTSFGPVFDATPFAVSQFNIVPTTLGRLTMDSASLVSYMATVAPLNEPPDCSSAGADPDEIWPPDQMFADVSVVGVTDPDGDPVTITVTGIAQDEPLEGLGDGNTCPDALGVDTDIAVVRAERSGTKKTPSDGRVYHISFTADDGQGGECSEVVTVCVPHHQRPGHVCVDQGPLFDSTVCGE